MYICYGANNYRWCRRFRGASISKEVEQRLEVVTRRQVVHQRRPETEGRSKESRLKSMKFTLKENITHDVTDDKKKKFDQ